MFPPNKDQVIVKVEISITQQQKQKVRGRFHQRFSRAFFVRLIQNVTGKKDVRMKNAREKRW